MKEIMLTDGRLTQVSDEDFMYLLNITTNWTYSTRYIQCWKMNPKRSIHMHKEVAKRKGLNILMYIDHKDGNRFNNQRNNIRECTQSQNLMNRSSTIASKTGIKNIHWNFERRKYEVQIKAYGKIVFHKRFDSLEEAIEERNKILIKYHGEFARLN